MSEYTVRPMQPSDAAFVLHAWRSGAWQEHFAKLLPVSEVAWWSAYHPVVERLLATSCVRVAVLRETGDLLGFACGDSNELHWAYVKQVFRGLGVGRALIPEHVARVSCWSRWAERHGIPYTPVALRRIPERIRREGVKR